MRCPLGHFSIGQGDDYYQGLYINRLRVSLVPNTDGTVRIATTADRAEGSTIPRSAVAIDRPQL